MTNLVLLCQRHHVGYHDGKFRIAVLPKARFRFISADGREIGKPVAGAAERSGAPIEDDFAYLAPDAATTRWDGQRLDREYAVSVLAHGRGVPIDESGVLPLAS